MPEDDKKHPLKSKWFVSYQPNVTEEIIKAHHGSYEEAQQATLKKLDYVTTVEALYATINSLLQWTQQPPKDALIFAREGIAPFFASFPGGHRLWLFTNSITHGKKAIEIVMALVMGESLRRVCDGQAAVQVVRIMHKPNAKSVDGLHLDIWMSSKQYCAAVKGMIQDQLDRADVRGEFKDVAI